jgi:predicted DNA-binding protein (UPF0251 family)/predicted Fe-Mo cluster-binding NifX family protein
MSEKEVKKLGRPVKHRKICRKPKWDCFVPEGQKKTREKVVLSLDDYEAIRLIDLEGLTHAQCAEQMDISRTTVTEIYEAARHKIAEALVLGKSLEIAGGHVRLCAAAGCCRRYCRERADTLKHGKRRKEKDIMRIAIPYDNGEIFGHFGHTKQFKLYDAEDGKVKDTRIVDCGEAGHGALAGVLQAQDADVLICGGIGGGAQMALQEAGIQLFGGVSGDADAAAEAYLAGNLQYDPNPKCHHHEGGHHCGHHHEGGHHCHHHAE